MSRVRRDLPVTDSSVATHVSGSETAAAHMVAERCHTSTTHAERLRIINQILHVRRRATADGRRANPRAIRPHRADAHAQGTRAAVLGASVEGVGRVRRGHPCCAMRTHASMDVIRPWPVGDTAVAYPSQPSAGSLAAHTAARAIAITAEAFISQTREGALRSEGTAVQCARQRCQICAEFVSKFLLFRANLFHVLSRNVDYCY